jgi:hypothetical protein
MRKKAEVKQESQEDKDLAMMSDPRLWPRWPWLPMKRHGKDGLECATLHADAYADKPNVLYTITLYEIKTYFPTPEMPKTKEYPNFAAMLQDGWEVD